MRRENDGFNQGMRCISFAAFSLAILGGQGCRTSDLQYNVSDSAKMVSASPVLVPAAAYVGTRGSIQKTAIATSLPTRWYSGLISGEELKRRMNQLNKLAKWEYMGTKNGFHFIACTEIFRRIYRVGEDEFAMEKPFVLTSRKSRWRRIDVHLPSVVIEGRAEPSAVR